MAASAAARIMSRPAATSRPRESRAPSSPVISAMGTKSSWASSTGIGTKSWTCIGRAFFSSFSGIQSRSACRTTTRWLATPRWTVFPPNLTCRHRSFRARVTASPSTTAPSRTAPAGRATWP